MSSSGSNKKPKKGSRTPTGAPYLAHHPGDYEELPVVKKIHRDYQHDSGVPYRRHSGNKAKDNDNREGQKFFGHS